MEENDMPEIPLKKTNDATVVTADKATVFPDHDYDEIANMDYSDYIFFLAEIEHR